MTDDNAAFDRLRAADPAAGVEPDLDKIHAVVAQATGVPLVPEIAVRPFTERAERRHRTRTRWMQAAAAVAAIAVVGTGGYAVGGGFGGADGEAAVALPPISLSGGDSDGATAEGGAAAMSADKAAGRSMIYPGFGWRTVFSGQGLSTAGGSAAAYGFDASTVASAETAALVAAALGVSGEPRVEWGSWVVGPNDGSGPSVTLSGDGMASVSYYNPSRDAWLCQNGDAGAAEPADSAKTLDEKAAPMPDPQGSVCETGSTPTGDAAVAMARDALTAIGVDLTDAVVSVDDSGATATDLPGAAYVSVTFSQVIDGQQTGVQYSVTLVGDGVQSLYATLGTLVDLGEYGIISAAEAVDRLNDPRFGGSGGIIAYGREIAAADAAVTVEPSQDPTVPPAPQAGEAISWPVQQVTLTSARLGLAMVTLSTGGQALVPAYELSDAEGTTWSVIAVVDSQLDFATK